jgi:uncharacterized damage-inducible protein DinB
MGMRAHIALMASYNEWMNVKLYDAAARLPAQELHADKGAFFGSLFGTLNHIAVGDTIWLKRFAAHPSGHAALDPIRATAAPATLAQALAPDLDALRARRQLLDAVIRDWAAQLSEDDLSHVLHYANTKGIQSRRRFASLVMHFFNHQTHHRGQASTLLSQAGVDIGVTDLLALVPEED